MKIKFIMDNMILNLLVVMILRDYGVCGEKVVPFRFLSQSDFENDNSKFEKLLKCKDTIVLRERMKIALESWKSIDIENKKLIGYGHESKVELYVGNAVSVSLFHNLLNCEVYNITIEIISPKNEIEIESGLINKIEECKIRKFHIIINKNIVLNEGNILNGLISNQIINSEINDIGIIFNRISIYYTSQSIWCLVSCEISNHKNHINNYNYSGIFLKGDSLVIIPESKMLNVGLLFYSTTNINFNYVVIDIEDMKINSNSQIGFSFFIDKSTSDIEINYMMIVVRNKIIYEDVKPSYYGMHLTGVVNEIMAYKTLKLNHYVFDIHVDEIKFKFVDAIRKNLKKEFDISGITFINFGNLIGNYIQVKFYFNDIFIVKKDRFCSVSFHGIHYCKTVMLGRLLVALNKGDISVNNSYFNVDKEIDKEVSRIRLINSESDGVTNVKNSYLNDINDLVDINDDDERGDVYVKMKLLNKDKDRNFSLIFDSSMPYFNCAIDYVNYDVFLKVKEKDDKDYQFEGKINNIRNHSYVFVYVIVVLLLITSIIVYYNKNRSIEYNIINPTENL